MRINFSARGNGGCPLCKKEKGCLIRKNLSHSIAGLKETASGGVEIVIYTCPLFVEKM